MYTKPSAEKLGTGFAIVKSDVGGNIDRLATRAATNPTSYQPDIFQILRDEVASGEHTGSSSCTKGLLWLKRLVYINTQLPSLPQCVNIFFIKTVNTLHFPSFLSHRAMQFVVALLNKLYTDRQISLSEAASETYYATLQQYHGWIVTGTFTVALKLVPSR